MAAYELDASPLAAIMRAARAHYAAGDFGAAETACGQAIELNAGEVEAYLLLAKARRAQDRGDTGLDVLSEATRLDPDNPGAFRQLARALAEAGRLTDAIEADRAALRLDPGQVGALCHLAQLKRFRHASDPDLDAIEALVQAEERLTADEMVQLLFSLAKAYEEIGAFDRAFEQLERANALKRRSIEYDVSDDLDFFTRITRSFDREQLERGPDVGALSETPIFIVGMPRSGTTLVEQILASHPAVHGAGELGYLHQLSTSVWMLNESGRQFPAGVADLDPGELQRLGSSYLERLPSVGPAIRRITDKNPLNFPYVGMLRLILPRARVIHCVRDPVDTCVSCYRSHFRSVDFAYDLTELGRYYRGYARLMDHWRATLPADGMLEVQYERLVENTEAEARRIVAYCGLTWDEGCLRFYETKRVVQTLSFAQVRRPVYRDSVAGWRRYERHLGPLLAALD